MVLGTVAVNIEYMSVRRLEGHSVTRRVTTRLAALLVVFGAGPLAAQDDPVAFVVRLEGAVQVHAGADAPAPATIGQRLFVGDQIVPAAGARAFLVLSSGAQQLVTRATTVSAPAGGASSDLFARAMSALAYAASSDARERGGRIAAIRPITGETAIVEPDSMGVVTTRPRLLWTATAGAERYYVLMQRVPDGALREFETPDTSVALPDNVPDLVHGSVYSLSVDPRPSGRLVSTGFRVIGVVAEVDLGRRLERIAALGLDQAGTSLLSAAVYRDADLLHDALGALEEVERSAQPLGRDFYNLKGDVLNRLGRFDEARAAFARADARPAASGAGAPADDALTEDRERR